MRVERLEEPYVTAADEAAIADLLGGALNVNLDGRSYYQQRHHFRLVLRDPQIIGHMALCYRDVRLGSELIPIMGLAEVATAANRRNEGIASRLLRSAIKIATATRAEFLLLFGDEPIYARQGFVAQPNEITYLTLDRGRTGQIKTGAHGKLMVRQLSDSPWNAAAPLDLLGHKF